MFSSHSGLYYREVQPVDCLASVCKIFVAGSWGERYRHWKAIWHFFRLWNLLPLRQSLFYLLFILENLMQQRVCMYKNETNVNFLEWRIQKEMINGSDRLFYLFLVICFLPFIVMHCYRHDKFLTHSDLEFGHMTHFGLWIWLSKNPSWNFKCASVACLYLPFDLMPSPMGKTRWSSGWSFILGLR